jgi:hypothetical protein
MSKTLPLSRGLVTTVDDDVYEWVSHQKWAAHPAKNTWYATRLDYQVRPGKATRIYLHRLVMGAPPELQVNHIDGGGLNNQRKNLSLSTGSVNCGSFATPRLDKTSRFRGVRFYASRGKWSAQIGVNLKSIHLGYFVDEEQAARARDAAALHYFGPTAQLNFPVTPLPEAPNSATDQRQETAPT